jgi:hypothetical protein
MRRRSEELSADSLKLSAGAEFGLWREIWSRTARVAAWSTSRGASSAICWDARAVSSFW